MYLIRWAWSQVDKDGTGEISASDLASMTLLYNVHVAESGDVVSLIKRCYTNQDKDLDVSEIAELLVVNAAARNPFAKAKPGALEQ